MLSIFHIYVMENTYIQAVEEDVTRPRKADNVEPRQRKNPHNDSETIFIYVAALSAVSR